MEGFRRIIPFNFDRAHPCIGCAFFNTIPTNCPRESETCVENRQHFIFVQNSGEDIKNV